jgi:hypothetical protein
VYYGVFDSLSHWVGNGSIGKPGQRYCGGMLREEPHGDCSGGLTGFDLPLNDAAIELAELTCEFMSDADTRVMEPASGLTDDDAADGGL